MGYVLCSIDDTNSVPLRPTLVESTCMEANFAFSVGERIGENKINIWENKKSVN